jgi:hypothetical protein
MYHGEAYAPNFPFFLPHIDLCFLVEASKGKSGRAFFTIYQFMSVSFLSLRDHLGFHQIFMTLACCYVILHMDGSFSLGTRAFYVTEKKILFFEDEMRNEIEDLLLLSGSTEC